MSAINLGAFEARYVAFIETIKHLRPSLHRYCARMPGSVLDGEDIVQEALYQAYRKLETFDDSRPLGPWIFRIAHNRCVDWLRSCEVRMHVESEAAESDWVAPFESDTPALGRAVEHLVLTLLPMKRACILLKDVLDYQLSEIAELVDSTVGGTKAALARGRAKLAVMPEASPLPRTAPPERLQLLRLYVERFNRRDWEGLRDLITSDARLRVADRFDGKLANAPYYAKYRRIAVPWHAALAELDGELGVIVFREQGGEWVAHSAIRIESEGHKVTRVLDLLHCPWILSSAMYHVVSGS